MRNLWLMAILVSAPALAIDFKGVVMGEHIDDAALDAKLGPPNPVGLHTTQLEGLVVFTRVTLEADRVEKLDVEFLPAEFSVIAAAATRKWGKPKSQKTAMQNGFGAQFGNVMLTWEREGWTVTMFKYVEADSGSLSIERTAAPKAIAPKDRL